MKTRFLHDKRKYGTISFCMIEQNGTRRKTDSCSFCETDAPMDPKVVRNATMDPGTKASRLTETTKYALMY